MTRQRLLMLVAGVLVAGAIGTLLYRSHYALPMAERRAERAALEEELLRLERERGDLLPARERLRALGGATLGRSSEQVAARLRTVLNGIGQACGLDELKVASSARGGVANPAALERVREYDRDQRRRPDFAVASGTLEGIGDSAATLRAIALVEAQPWLLRVTRTSLKPRGARLAVRIDVETAYAPGLAEPAAEIAGDVAPAGGEALSELVAAGLFRPPPEPPPPPTPPPTPRPEPPPAPAPGAETWIVTGVTTGSAGDELWVRNVNFGADRRLRSGEDVAGIGFVTIRGADAVIEADGERYLVRVGDTLAVRERPVRAD